MNGREAKKKYQKHFCDDMLMKTVFATNTGILNLLKNVKIDIK